MWAIDGLANFLPYAGLPLLAAAPASFFFRSRTLLVILAIPVVVWLVFLVSLGLFVSTAGDAPADAPRLRVVTANVLMSNERLDEFALDILNQRADIVVFEELRHDLAVLSPALDEAYPYRISTAAPWVTLASRFPIGHSAVLPIQADDRGRDLLTATVDVHGQRLTVIAVHFVPPLNAEAYAVNRQQRRVLEAAVAGVDGPLMVIGDFNATTLSPTFARLLLGTDLRIASTDRFLSPTYYAYGYFGVRIDHVLVRGLDVVDDEVFELRGSDHRGLAVEVGLRAPSNGRLVAKP